MDELKIFSFEDYEIRTLLIEKEPYFVGKDVAEVLGYKNTKDALISHVDEEDKRVVQKSEIATLENNIPKEAFAANFIWADIPNRGLTIINESGLYSLILSSKLPQAKDFKRWVTKEVLPSIRKTGGYKVPSSPMEALKLMFDVQKEQDQKIEKVDQRVTNLERTTTIVSSQQLTLTKIAKATAIRVLGGKDSYAYRNLSRKVFKNLWHDYKEYFKVPSYKDTLRTDYERAVKYLEQWRPDTNLAYEIQERNIEF